MEIGLFMLIWGLVAGLNFVFNSECNILLMLIQEHDYWLVVRGKVSLQCNSIYIFCKSDFTEFLLKCIGRIIMWLDVFTGFPISAKFVSACSFCDLKCALQVRAKIARHFWNNFSSKDKEERFHWNQIVSWGGWQNVGGIVSVCLRTDRLD